MSLTFNPADTTAPPGQVDDSGPRPYLPEGTVLDVVVTACSVENVDLNFTPWRTKGPWVGVNQYVKFEFKPTDPDNFKYGRFWHEVPAVLNNAPGNQLRLVMQSLLGLDDLAAAFPGGVEFSPEDYVDAKAQIRLGTYFSKKKQEVKNSVEDVLPAQAAAPVTPTGSISMS